MNTSSALPGLSTKTANKPAKRDLTRDEARTLVTTINDHADRAIVLINELRERNGWKALGYSSWIECAVAEFGQSRARVYQLLKAAQIQLELEEESTIVDSIPESHLRPLATLPTPQERKEAWEEAKATAPDGKMTASHVQGTVDKLRGKINNIINPPPKKEEPKPKGVHYSSLGDAAPDAAVSGADDEYERAVHEEFARQKARHREEYPLHAPCAGTFWFPSPPPPGSRFVADER